MNRSDRPIILFKVTKKTTKIKTTLQLNLVSLLLPSFYSRSPRPENRIIESKDEREREIKREGTPLHRFVTICGTQHRLHRASCSYHGGRCGEAADGHHQGRCPDQQRHAAFERHGGIRGTRPVPPVPKGKGAPARHLLWSLLPRLGPVRLPRPGLQVRRDGVRCQGMSHFPRSLCFPINPSFISASSNFFFCWMMHYSHISCFISGLYREWKKLIETGWQDLTILYIAVCHIVFIYLYQMLGGFSASYYCSPRVFWECHLWTVCSVQ